MKLAMPCPSRQDLYLCLQGKLNDMRSDALLEHVEQCETCGRIVQELDDNSDDVAETLKRQSDFDLSEECERMIEGAELYVTGDFPKEDPGTDTKRYLLQGQRIRDYEIVRPLGEGGMGTVFLAIHQRLNCDVALKVLSLRRAGDAEAQKRFEQEMAIVGKLQHPGIVRALDAGEYEGVQYLAMELIDGADLRQIVDALGPLSVADACEICRQTAVALEYAHEQQLIHRDVKPSNIMLTRQGDAKLMDLGLARFEDQRRSLTSTQQALGSLDFMAPEQLRASVVDGRADVYGLGCTLHYLLMGEPPEKRRTASLMVARTPKLESLRDLLPPPLVRLLQKMLAADPARRTIPFTEVARQLAPFCNRAELHELARRSSDLQNSPSSESSGEVTSRIKKQRRPRLARRTMVATALFLPLAFGVFWFARGGSGEEATLIELTGATSVSSNMRPVREIPLFQIHDGAVHVTEFCEETQQLVCGSDDGSITIRDLPDQTRTIRVCEFDGAVRQLCLDQENRLVAALDETGRLVVIALPTGEVIWRSDANSIATSRQANPVKIVAEEGRIFVDYDDSQTRVLEVEGGKVAFRSAKGPSPDEDLQVPRRTDRREQDIVVGKLRRDGEPIDDVAAHDIDGMLGIVENNLVRLLNPQHPEKEHFVYAEHTSPICDLRVLADGSLVLTTDESGEIRLWQVPDRIRSVMLLSCGTRIDSAEMTFQIQRQMWTRRAFSTAPEDVKLDGPGGEMRIETEIERNGNRHVLEYRIGPP